MSWLGGYVGVGYHINNKVIKGSYVCKSFEMVVLRYFLIPKIIFIILNNGWSVK